MPEIFKKALPFALIYCAVSISFKIYIILSGLILTRFGFYYSHAITLLFMIPYLFLSLWIFRKKNFPGEMSGRIGFQFLLSVLVWIVLGMSLYHAVEFRWKIQDLAETYYRSSDYLNFLKQQSRIKPEDYSKIIDEQIQSLSVMKAVTSKIMAYLILGISSSFIFALLGRR
jgi:glucan phosphoethanolaminetransferase (alkaline phosphatase superfamily)